MEISCHSLIVIFECKYETTLIIVSNGGSVDRSGIFVFQFEFNVLAFMSVLLIHNHYFLLNL